MSVKLIATQIAGVTLGVVGAGLILNAVDKVSTNGIRSLPVFEKINRLKGSLEEPRVERVMVRVYEPVVRAYSPVVVFDDNFAFENFEDY